MSEETDRISSLSVEPRRKLDDIFAGLADDPAKRVEQLRALRRSFVEALGERLGPAINDIVRTMPQETPEDCRRVASWVNDILRETDLRVREASTGLPGLVIADVKSGKEAHIPRYRIVIKHRAEGKSGYGKAHYGPLFDLSLMPAPTRIEPFSHSFQRRVSAPDDDAGRQR